MNFTVTGGAGFIGSHLAKHLVEQGHQVSIIDNLISGKLENISSIMEKITFHEIDILDYDGLKKSLKNSDGVFHLAGLTDVQESFRKKEQYRQVNVAGTENVLKLARELGFKVVFASSASVYGDIKNIPIPEDSEKIPLNPYGQSKSECEQLCEKYAKLGVGVVVLRYFNVFGQGQNKTYAGVISKFLENITNKRPPVIHGDGLQVRDFVFVGDVAKANLTAMLSQDSGVFNIGSGTATSIISLANTMVRLSSLDVTPVHDDALEGDVRSSQADITLAKRLGWHPQTSIEEWLKQTLASEAKI